MREIIIFISDNNIVASDDFAGYAGEHNATVLKFKLPEELQNPKYKYIVNITLPDDITATATLRDMSLVLTSTLTACEGIIALQLVVSEGSSLVYKSGITNIRIKPSLAPDATIGGSDGADGVGIASAIVNEEGNLIITLTDDNVINAGYVLGADGKDGINGVDGKDGEDGTNGIDGKSITSALVNDSGYLTITLTNGEEINAGYVKGADGEKGDKGDKGDPYTLTETDKSEIANELSADIIRGIIENNIQALEIPEGTVKIFDNQFKDNSELRRVVAPDSLEIIGECAFQDCYKLTGIDGLKGLKEIGRYAFSWCNSLTDIEFPETLETIGDNAFLNCEILGNQDLILPNCKKVPTNAFFKCSFTGKLDLSKCEEIGSNAFLGSDFSSLKLSNALTKYASALSDCESLEFVDLGNDFDCDGLILSMSTKYSVDTLVGILNSLKDRTGETAYTLTLGSTNLAKLTDEQKKIATNKNWVLA